MKISESVSLESLQPQIDHLFSLSGPKILAVHETWDVRLGSPVFTAQGRYATRGWTEWTQGFKNGMAILQFDATGDEQFLRIGREQTVAEMAVHVSDAGVHDHGFNNISTYGNLRRLMLEGRIPLNESELNHYELALKVSGAVQANRWVSLGENAGYIYSFNGPHSLFADTIRSLRILGLSHILGHVLLGENNRKHSLLDRLLQHSRTTARYSVYYGEGRDAYDIEPGRVAHESLFNIHDGQYRCPNTQQGYSPFTTWTRGLAWILSGYAELLEFCEALPEQSWKSLGGREEATGHMLKAALATAEFYINHTSLDGVPYWDTGAPGLRYLEDYRQMTAMPENDYEPVDSSAATIAAQGLIRLGQHLLNKGDQTGKRYFQAGLTVAATIFAPPYLSESLCHQGLILHSVYHRPNGWDYIPEGHLIPCGESSMWGDYHALELAVLLRRMNAKQPNLTFFGGNTKMRS